MSTQPTPGPWRVIPSIHGDRYLCVELDREAMYCTLEMKPADAHLIAAAPDLPGLGPGVGGVCTGEEDEETMSRPTFLSMFSGGGLSDIGALAAGCELVGAVEIDPQVCEVYADNHGAHILCAKVEDVDYRRWAGVDVAWASPVCTSFSVAKAGRAELDIDMTAAEAVCRMLREARPQGFCLENVRGYAKSCAFALICETLTDLGYWFVYDVLNSADFLVAQTRQRLILRACLDGVPAPLPMPTRWVGWYEAIEDLLPGLPPSQFARWQLERLPAELTETMMLWNMDQTMRDTTLRKAGEPCPTVDTGMFRRPSSIPQAFLVESKNANQQYGDGLRPSHEPATTVVTDGKPSHMPKAFLMQVAGEASDYREQAEPAPTITSAHAANKYRAFLVEGTAAGADNPFPLQARTEAEPVFTVHGTNPLRAFLVDCQNNGGADPDTGLRGLTIREAPEPAHTITGTQTKRTVRAWLDEGRVVSMTPRALGRFMSLPDSYRLPKSNKVACSVIGNGVCCLVAKAAIESVLKGNQ